MKKLTFNYTSCPKCQNSLKNSDKSCLICGNKKIVDKAKTMIIYSVVSVLFLPVFMYVADFQLPKFSTLTTEKTITTKNNQPIQQPTKEVSQDLCTDKEFCVKAQDINLDEIDDPDMKALYKVHQDQARQFNKVKELTEPFAPDE